MRNHYFIFDGEPGWTGFKIIQIEDYGEMIEKVREYYDLHDRHPTVFHGVKLEFKPAEIVKSWKVKES